MARNAAWFRTFAYAALAVLLAVYLYPLYMLVSFSFKTNTEITQRPFSFPAKLRWDNYADAWHISNFGRALGNSVTVTVLAVLAITALGALAAYPLAKRKSRLSTAFYVYFIAGLVIPIQLNLVPLFKLILNIGLDRTLAGVIVLYIAFAMPIAVFLFTGFMRTVPGELEDAGRIDGCNGWQLFVRIVFPLLKPITTTVVILQFLSVWNDFFLPVVFLNSEKLRTVQIAMYSFMGRYSNDWAHMFPMLVVSVLPVLALYLFLQRYIIAGMMSGSIKG